jgi:large subunit ribosomal protein L24
MKIRKDDNVIVISGKDKGKTGKVLKAFPRENKVLITGVNVIKRHERPRKSGSKGQVVDKTMPINASNVMIVDPKDGKRTRIGLKFEAGKKTRVTKNSGSTL